MRIQHPILFGGDCPKTLLFKFECGSDSCDKTSSQHDVANEGDFATDIDLKVESKPTGKIVFGQPGGGV